MKKEQSKTKEKKVYPASWWYHNWVPQSFHTPTTLNAEPRQTTSANRDKPEISQQPKTTDDKQTEVDANILTVSLTTSPLSTSLPVTTSTTLSTADIVKNNSKPSLLLLIANYQRKRDVLNRKINKHNANDKQQSDSQLQKIDLRLIIDDNVTTPFVNVKKSC